MHGSRTEVGGGGGGGGGGGRWPVRTHLENHKFYREYAIEFDPHPCWTPFGTKKYSFLCN